MTTLLKSSLDIEGAARKLDQFCDSTVPRHGKYRQ